MPDTTIIALFDKFDAARAARDQLIAAGIPEACIGLLVNTALGDHPPPISNPSYAVPQAEPAEESTADIGIGGAVGVGAGAIVGAALELSAFLLPGVGPVMAIGLWPALFAGVGGVVGGAIAALRSQGVPFDDAALYTEGLRRGGTLLLVRSSYRNVSIICRIAEAQGACDIEERDRSWRADGWVGFDREAMSRATDETPQKAEPARSEASGHRSVRHYFHPEHSAPSGGPIASTHFAEDVLKGW